MNLEFTTTTRPPTGLLAAFFSVFLAAVMIPATTSAQHSPPEGITIDGKRDLFIRNFSPPHKGLGTQFKRRGDAQTFRIRNRGSFTWLLSVGLIPSNFEVRIPPQPNVLHPGSTSEFTLAYLGGRARSGNLFSMIFQDTTNAPHRDYYYFHLGNTPKKRKGHYDGNARNLKIRDGGGSTPLPPSPITLNLPVGRGAFNGTLWTAQSDVFLQNVNFQGRIQDFKERRGGKKMILEGFWRWKLDRLGYPGRGMGKFRWHLTSSNRGEATVSGNLSAGGKGFSLSGRFRANLNK